MTDAPAVPPAVPGATTLGTTGRFLVLMREGQSAQGATLLKQAAGLRVASTADFSGQPTAEELSGSDGLLLHQLGVAVVSSPPDAITSLAASETSGVLAVEPERVVQSVALESEHAVYLRGYRDAVNHLYDALAAASAESVAKEALEASLAEVDATWGLQVTKVLASSFSGKGVRVAILDTGLDLGHPDFAGRPIVSGTFVPGEPVQDLAGHGTHCIGTSCGPRRPGTAPRYGIAYDAEIYAGKVLSNQGRGGDGGILAGINWAVTNRCAVVSMSLGAPVQLGQGYSQVFETTAQRALAAGTLIVAAAGNDSERPGYVAPVGHPANCPSILAVAAVDQNGAVAIFSCGGLNPQGGQVDIAAPGVAVRSAWPRPQTYNTISGTSMATPHVAGVAALFAESNPAYRGKALADVLLKSAKQLNLPIQDVGAGLVQAP